MRMLNSSANRKQGPDHEALSFNIWSSNLISIFQVINAALYYILDAELLNLNLSKWHQSCLYMVGKSSEYITFYPDKRKIQCCLKERGWSLWWQQNRSDLCSVNLRIWQAIHVAQPQDITETLSICYVCISTASV